MTAPRIRQLLLLLLLTVFAPATQAAENKPAVYVILWFDTEDYLLPASDDAAKHVADFLTDQGIRATFKIVGEKARTLERRGRADVIAALKKHEIGYHANTHSTQPSPAMYLNDLNWDDGVAEFDRRERPGVDDIQRIFGVTPTCYGQPGSSWGPQSYGAMRQWGLGVYLDSGSHVRLDDKPYYYAGVLNLYKLAHTLRADLAKPDQLSYTLERFADARRALLAEGGGVVSVYYHPCEFVHKEFWDGVNFRHGANPPRQRWKAPPAKTDEERETAYKVFEGFVKGMKATADVRFITASEAGRLYADRARGRTFTPAELKDLARGIGADVSFVRTNGYALSASEVFVLLNSYVHERLAGRAGDAIPLKETPLGPTSTVPTMTEPVTTDASQFSRTVADVADFLARRQRIPSKVWLGSAAVPPEAYLRSLARVAVDLADGKAQPDSVTVSPTRLAAGDHVGDDALKLWGWVIFPPGFHAPALMELARRQAWTLKPALLNASATAER